MNPGKSAFLLRCLCCLLAVSGMRMVHAAPTDLQTTLPRPGALCARSIVLTRCPDANSPRLDLTSTDERKDRLRDRLQRNAQRLQERAASGHVDADFGTVVIEGQAERPELPQFAEHFQAPRIKRPSDPVATDERGLWGSRTSCVIGAVGLFSCAGSTGIPAAGHEHWMDSR